MTIKRSNNYVFITTAITKSEITYYHYYQQYLGTQNDLYAFLCADYAKLTLTGVTTTDTSLTEEIYDFASANSTNYSSECGYGEIVSINATDCNVLSSNKLEMNGRFAGYVANSSTWNVYKSNGGLGTTADRKFGVLNLSAGDYVTIIYTGTAPTFIGGSNISGESASTAVTSGKPYQMTSSGNLELMVPKQANTKITSIIIETSTPVLSAPNGKVFNSMVESEGLYYPKYTFTSSDEGVTFYDGDGNDITSGYTFMTTDPVTVYAGKAGRTNSAKVTYTSDKVGMIRANSVNASSLTGTINYQTGSTFEYGNNAEGTWVIPGLTFGANFYNYTTRITQTGGTRALTCTVLNENRIATINHYYYEKNATINDYLTSASNVATFHRSGSNYDHFYQYDLYVMPSEIVSVTIGSTGYSTFSSPVPLNFAGIEGLTAYVATTVGGGNVTLTSVTTAPANTGLVLKGTAGKTYNIPVTNSAATPASNLLVGCIVNTTVAADATSGFNNYVLVNEGGTPKFQSLVDNGATIPAGKAFLKNGAYSLGARSLNIVFDDETTGIENLTPALSEGEGAFYDLQGRRVAQPTKGLYIKNGKKVIMK